MNITHTLWTLLDDDSGQDLIEYALLAVFISLIAITAVTNVGTSVDTLYGAIEGEVTEAAVAAN